MRRTSAALASVGFNSPRGPWHIAAHHHSNYEMIVVTRGHEDVAVHGRKLRAGVGDILLFKPGVAHEEWSWMDDPVQTFFLSFSWPGDTSGWPLHCVDEQGRVRLLSSWLYAGRDSAGAEIRAAGEAFFLALIREYIRLQGRQEDPLVASVRDFVRRNLDAPLTVDGLARHAGVSKFHFIRRYRRLTGRSPMEDVRMIRVGYARDMILTSSLPVKAIASMAGLGDDISLYRLFRRYLKMTPGQLRRTVR